MLVYSMYHFKPSASIPFLLDPKSCNSIYMKILKTRYVLAVQDLAKSVDYYKTKLGFETIWDDGAGWHCLGRGGWEVMLGECRDDRSAFELENHSYFAYINVEGVDELHQEFQSKGVNIMHMLE